MKKAKLVNKNKNESIYKEMPVFQEKPFTPKIVKKDLFEHWTRVKEKEVFYMSRENPLVVDGSLFISVNDRFVTDQLFTNTHYDEDKDVFVIDDSINSSFPTSPEPFITDSFFSPKHSELFEALFINGYTGVLNRNLFYLYGLTTHFSRIKKQYSKFPTYVYLLPINIDKLNIVMTCHTCGEVEYLNADINAFFFKFSSFIVDKEIGTVLYVQSEKNEKYQTKSNTLLPLHSCVHKERLNILEVVGFLLDDFYDQSNEVVFDKEVSLSVYDDLFISKDHIVNKQLYFSSSDEVKHRFLDSVRDATLFNTNIYTYKNLYYTDVLPDELYSQKVMNHYNLYYPRFLLPNYAVKKLKKNENMYKFIRESMHTKEIKLLEDYEKNKEASSKDNESEQYYLKGTV